MQLESQLFMLKRSSIAECKSTFMDHLNTIVQYQLCSQIFGF